MKLFPFFTYYGGKYRAAPYYPKPKHELLFEPFAGSAGYATRHHTHSVVLSDRDPVIRETWKFLISAQKSDILSLPLLKNNEKITDFSIPDGARYLIGFWLNKGASRPCVTPSAWMRSGIRPKSYWGEEIRDRIAKQVSEIKHWYVSEAASYDKLITEDGTWFIDPPYQMAGKHYKCGASEVDFTALARWCQTLKGQVIVCENEGAQWLPFVPFRNIKASPARNGGKISKEVIWCNS